MAVLGQKSLSNFEIENMKKNHEQLKKYERRQRLPTDLRNESGNFSFEIKFFPSWWERHAVRHVNVDVVAFAMESSPFEADGIYYKWKSDVARHENCDVQLNCY